MSASAATSGYLSRDAGGREVGLVAAALAAAVALGLLAALLDDASLLVGAALALSLLVAVAAMPVLGSFIWLLIGPMIIGIARGGASLPLRPNELLLLVIAAG